MTTPRIFDFPHTYETRFQQSEFQLTTPFRIIAATVNRSLRFNLRCS